MLGTHVTRDIISLSFMCDPPISSYIIERWNNFKHPKLLIACLNWGNLCPKSILDPRSSSSMLARLSTKIFCKFSLQHWIVSLLHCNSIIDQQLPWWLTTWPWDSFPYHSCVTLPVTAVLSTHTWHTICFLPHYLMMTKIVTADPKFGSMNSNSNNDLSVEGVSSGDESISSLVGGAARDEKSIFWLQNFRLCSPSILYSFPFKTETD